MSHIGRLGGWSKRPYGDGGARKLRMSQELAERRQRFSAYAVVVNDGHILLARIAPGYPGAGSWTLPGGGIDWGEHPEDAMHRELYEETGLAGETISLLGIDSLRLERRRDGQSGALSRGGRRRPQRHRDRRQRERVGVGVSGRGGCDTHGRAGDQGARDACVSVGRRGMTPARWHRRGRRCRA